MPNTTLTSNSHEEVWWTLQTDRDLLHHILSRLRDERRDAISHDIAASQRDEPWRIEHDVQVTLGHTNELIQALSAGHLLHETWRGQFLDRDNQKIEALGIISVRTYGDRVQQVRYRTNELICECARLQVWQNL